METIQSGCIGVRRCKLAAITEGSKWCILHDPNPGKDVASFTQALDEAIQAEDESDASEIDLSWVIFPVNVDFRRKVFNKTLNFSNAEFKGAASFDDAQFSGNLLFRGTRFKGPVSFFGAQFNGATYFSSAQFVRQVHFSYARFNSWADFHGTQFNDEAHFSEAKFADVAHFNVARFSRTAHFWSARFSGQVSFYGAQFDGEGHFRDAQFSSEVVFTQAAVQDSLNFQGRAFLSTETDGYIYFKELNEESARRIRFDGVNLSRVSSLRTDVSHVRFVGCTWTRKDGRKVIHDELALDNSDILYEFQRPTPQLVSETYRQLRLNYESNRQEAEAGDFYIGQMEMRRRDNRKDEGYSWAHRRILEFYRIIGMYGESYGRPMIFYLILALLFALGYWRLGNVSYAEGLFTGLTAGALFDEVPKGIESWEKLLVYLNMLADIFLLGITLVALRRHFRR